MPNPEDNGKDRGKAPRKQVDAYLKYSGMAVQMGVIMLIGTFAGQQLDARFQTERPYLTVLFALLSIFAALYLTLKDILSPKNEDK